MTRTSQSTNVRNAYWRPAILCCAVLGMSLLLLLSANPAHAQTDAASCTFFEIQATKDGKGVDSKLKKLEKKLLHPMFSAWTKFDQLGKHDATLTLNATNVIAIAKGAKLSVLYKEYSKGKKERFKLQITVIGKNGKRALGTDFTVEAGNYMLISMPTKDKDKGYILGSTCKKK